MEKVRRYQIADYLKVSNEFVLMGAGFNSLDESTNPNVDKKCYVSDKCSSATLTGYEPEWAFDADHIKDEKAIAALHKVGRDRLTGTEAEFEYCRVDLYAGPSPEGTTYPARLFRVAAEIAELDTGEGGQVVTLTGTLHQIADHQEGTFDVSTKKFTPAG